MSGDQSNLYAPSAASMSIAPEAFESNVTFVAQSVEMLRITRDGFFVRGVKVEQGEGEAQAVYEAFMTWMHAQGGWRK